MKIANILTSIIISLLSITAQSQVEPSGEAAAKAISTQPKKQTKLPEMVPVTRVQYVNNPTYQTIIRPTIRNTLVSPIGGQIIKIDNQYGNYVKRNDPLLQLNSNDAKKALMENIGNYIQSKDSYLAALSAAQKNKELKAKGVVSKQELRTSESAYIASLINLVRTRIEFKRVAEPLNFKWENISSINLKTDNLIDRSDEIEDNIEKLLGQDYIITLKSESTGIFLPKQTESEKDRIDYSVGNQLRSGQVIGIIANPNKLSLTFDVPEIDIVNLKKGQAVEMNVPILNNTKMQGEITQILRFQHKQSVGGKLPTIPVRAEIHCEENCYEFYSISAQATILNEHKYVLQVPLSAVHKEYDLYFVKVVQNDQIIKKEVTVGDTTAQAVNIKDGLNEGDQVVKNYKTTEN